MTRKPDLITADLPPGARTRVRLPDASSPARIFQGWGPGLGR
jgi:hypothetical protein